MMMTGRLVEAAEALSIGLVDRVVPQDRLMEETWELAKTIAAGPPLAIRDIKKAVYESENNELRMQVRLETEHQIRGLPVRGRDRRDAGVSRRERRSSRGSEAGSEVQGFRSAGVQKFRVQGFRQFGGLKKFRGFDYSGISILSKPVFQNDQDGIPPRFARSE